MLPPALLEFPDATVEFDGKTHVYISLPNGWIVSIVWGFPHYLKDVIPSAWAFTDKDIDKAEKTYPENVVESSNLEDFISFINEVAAFPPYVKDKPIEPPTNT